METPFAEAKQAPSRSQTAQRHIARVAVLGSGVMGSRIACHFANIGLDVLLLDIVPRELTAAESDKKLTFESPQVRNRIVNEALQSALKSNPSPIYDLEMAQRIRTGNFEDDFAQIKDADWVIEVVVERLDIKLRVFEQVEKYRRPGSLVTTNTSGIPINMMLDGRSEDFRAHFCGTHFFNPPRYLKLLEIIPSRETKPEVVDFLMHYGDRFLGKTTVLAKDTPAFIANRIGVHSIMSVVKIMQETGLDITQVDKLTGPVIGHPKSATFRTSDVVGLDTLVNVAKNLHAALKHDEARNLFELPDFIAQMAEKKWLGDKTKQGFYKKTTNEKGEREILALDLKKMDYIPSGKVKFATLETTKSIDRVAERLPVLVKGKDEAGAFYRKMYAARFAYASHRIPEIADELYRIDDALRAGFGWELGPFESWDAIGLEKGLELIRQEGGEVAAWINDMAAAGHTQFYKLENGVRHFYDVPSQSYQPVPGAGQLLVLDHVRHTHKVWGNADATLLDLGDGVLGVEFHTKMNSLGAGVIEGINKGIALAEKDFRALLIGNDAPNFSAGANLATLFMFAIEQEYDELEMMIRQFQQTITRVRFSKIPVVTAPRGLTLGGGCELMMHSDRAVAAAESYIGLVELGVGLIPAGCGTKEMALRVSDSLIKGDTELNRLQEAFMNIAMAKVGTSAHEARNMMYLRPTDTIVVNGERLLAEAKRAAVELAEAGYVAPQPRRDIKVQGKAGIALFMAGITGMHMGKYISDHDKKIAEKLAYVINGGDLSYTQMVSEQYLLDLEREAFLSLCTEKKTLERIQSLLQGGKPVRN